MEHVRFDRRTLLRTAGVTVGAALGSWSDADIARARGGEAGEHVTLHEGTNIAHGLSPDGAYVAFDLLTAVWIVPIAGGTATRLTDDDTDATQPCWSPDGRRLVFQSYRDGYYHVWTVRRDGTELTRHTDGPFDHREPKYSPDGSKIVFASDRSGDGSYGIFILDLHSGAISPVTSTENEEAMPAWAPDGRRIAYTVDDTAINVLDLRSGAVTTVVRAPERAELFGPSFAPDGETLAYVRRGGAVTELVVGDRVVSSDEDVFGFPVSWLAPSEIMYTADGRIKRRVLDGGMPATVAFAASVPVSPSEPRQRRRDPEGQRPALGIASPVASRDGRHVSFRALGAVWRLEVGDPKPERLVADGYCDTDPDFAPDGRSLVYSSDRAGDADLWVRDLDSGRDRRISGLPGAQLTPRFSPDGGRIAYTDHDGAVWVLDLSAGETTRVTPTLFMPGRPSWSPDGNTLTLAAVKPFSRRFREGTSQVLTVDVATGALTYTEPMPGASIATRGDDGPVWSPDGRHLAFVVESCAWLVPVDQRGRFTGTPRRINHEVTDSLSWLGPETLLYLNNGRLRSVSIDGSDPADIPMDLSWRPARAHEHTVVRAGALWDGHTRELRRDVDIVVRDGTITDVVPSGTGEATVDARHLTVLPGLIDAHNHWHLRGRQWGARQGRLWLAYGITTTRSPGDPAYQLVETREALESGEIIGPRLYGTGEAIDGARIYYNFMRATRSARQLELELERARKLGYDMIKTYVRLPVNQLRRVVHAADQVGLPLSSHYLYPAANLGMDGMEHTGSTNRLGYSHTVSRIGRAYSDAVDLFVRSGMSITPTLFHSAVLYAQDRSLVEDRRTRVLYPTWEHRRLVEKADQAGLPGSREHWAMLAANVDMLLRIHRRGGLVIAGTDAPLDNVAVSLHTNLRAMVRFGFTPFDALTTATRNTARWLGLSGRLGAVTPGAAADLAFVKGNPLEDIRAAADVRMVMSRGRLHTVEHLLAPFTETSRAEAPELTQHTLASAVADDDHWWHVPEWSQPVCCGA